MERWREDRIEKLIDIMRDIRNYAFWCFFLLLILCVIGVMTFTLLVNRLCL